MNSTRPSRTFTGWEWCRPGAVIFTKRSGLAMIGHRHKLVASRAVEGANWPSDVGLATGVPAWTARRNAGTAWNCRERKNHKEINNQRTEAVLTFIAAMVQTRFQPFNFISIGRIVCITGIQVFIFTSVTQGMYTHNSIQSRTVCQRICCTGMQNCGLIFRQSCSQKLATTNATQTLIPAFVSRLCLSFLFPFWSYFSCITYF